MRIVQVVPEVAIGRGVEAVAYHLEREWRALGHEVERFTLREAGGGWLPQPGPGLRGKLTVLGRVLWFTGPGSVAARRRWGKPDGDTVVVCHNDALVGDVYVNHGILAVAMKARGHGLARMLRNPLHVFTYVRDKARFAGTTHRYVVNQTTQSDRDLRDTYGRVRPRTVVIGNGVDTERYAPDAAERERIRATLGIPADAVVGVFVGHEYARKGLPAIVDALPGLPEDFHLIVVGGTPDLVATNRRQVVARGVAQRVHHVGMQSDPRPYLHAADVLVFPSAYESFSLVVTEALACGLPVVATPTGSVPDLIKDGVNGFVTDGTPEGVAQGICGYLASNRPVMAAAARATAERHSWRAVAQQYLNLFERVLAERRS